MIIVRFPTGLELAYDTADRIAFDGRNNMEILRHDEASGQNFFVARIQASAGAVAEHVPASKVSGPAKKAAEVMD